MLFTIPSLRKEILILCFYWRSLKKTILFSTRKLESYLYHPLFFFLLLLLYTFSFLPYTFRFISFPSGLLSILPSLADNLSFRIQYPFPTTSCMLKACCWHAFTVQTNICLYSLFTLGSVSSSLYFTSLHSVRTDKKNS
jgi:hypothetical protein